MTDDIEVEEVGEAEVDEPKVPQSTFENVLKKRMSQVEARTRKEMQAEFDAKMQEMQQAKDSQADQRGSNIPSEVDADRIYQQVQERINADRQRDIEERQQAMLSERIEGVVSTYQTRLDAAKGDYEDFDDVMGPFEADKFPEILWLLQNDENAAAVMYHLAKNPQKLTTVDRYIEKGAIKMAEAELHKLSKSILENRKAVAEDKQADVDAPMSRLQPSNYTGSNGKGSIDELRSLDWLKG